MPADVVHLGPVVVASKNPDKIAEVEAVLVGLGVTEEIVRGLSWPDVEETEDTLEGNALLKSRAVVAATGFTAIADDTGLEVAALDGAPGVYTARFAGPDATYDDNVTALLSALNGHTDRRAVFRTAVAVSTPDGREWIAEGHLDGFITHERRGEGGFGYDPIFEVNGRTLSEIPIDEKNAMSHRASALHAIGEVLRAG